MSTQFGALFEDHNTTTRAAGFDTGFKEGFLAGATVSVNFIMGWGGETRNPQSRAVAREVLAEKVAAGEL